MLYGMYLFLNGLIVEGYVLQETDEILKIEGVKHHIDIYKDDILSLQQAAISSQGIILDKSIFEIKKDDILERILEMSLNKEPQNWIEPEFVPDDNASRGAGYYNKKTGRRLLKVKPDTKPFGDCIVEVVGALMDDSIPYCIARVFQGNNYYEGISYRADTDLQDYAVT